jgi:hypothetical protein
MPLSSSIAQELVDMIIGYLWNDRRSLGICGLVHRDWLPSSRYHLFYKVSLSPYKTNTWSFFSLFHSDVITFPPYVTNLIVRHRWSPTSITWVNDTLPLVSGFVGVRYLVLWDIQWSDLSKTSLLTLATSFPNLTDLDLRGIDFDSFDQLVNMVSAYPMLKKLTVNDTACLHESSTPRIQYPAPQSLQHLTLSSFCNGNVLTWILLHKSAYVNISRLSVKLDSPDEVVATATLIRNLGPSLRVLHLQMPWKVPDCEGKPAWG